MHKKELDDKRLEIVRLEKQKEQLNSYHEQMRIELESEYQFILKEPEFSGSFGSYKNKITERQNNINLAVKDINKMLAKLNEEIAIIFGEVKKYEIILDQKKQQQIKEESEKEDKFLNEMALNNFLKAED